jgi:hypothetical protein
MHGARVPRGWRSPVCRRCESDNSAPCARSRWSSPTKYIGSQVEARLVFLNQRSLSLAFLNRALLPRPIRSNQNGVISFLSANPRSAFDSTAHFYGGDTTSLTLPAAVPADSLVCLGPNLLFVRFNCRRFFSECFIFSTTHTPEHNKTPVAF